MSATKTEDLLRKAESLFSPIDVSGDLKEAARRNLRRWLEEEPFPDASPQVEYLIESGNGNLLFDAFFRYIPFGTGGRRGPVGYGTNRFNPFTLATSIHGHCEFLKRHFPQAKELSVVVAYDVRVFRDLRGVYDPNRPNPLLGITSRDFARIAAEVYAANGVRVWFPDPSVERLVSTPELSFAIRRLQAHGGLNVSASHNHPDDNGAKIYNDAGGQEIPPLDEEMAKIVEAVERAPRLPWDEAVRKGLVRWIPPEVHEEYVQTNVSLSLDSKARSARIVFTPLHGTGWSSVGAALQGCGFQVECFPDQGTPDGTFPNVPFRSPNPEVRESLTAATEYARSQGADLVLAADPDADRLGLVAPDAEGVWTFFNGNEVGIVLTAYLLAAGAARKRKRPFGVTTVVTTSLFSRICREHGVRTVDDLPIGFKYIAHVLRSVEETGRYRDLEASVEDFLLGIEESHGYLLTHRIRDKDAAGAAVLLAELVSKLKDEGRTLVDYLEEVYATYGYVRNHLVSTVMQGARGFLNIRKIQDSLRKNPPERIGERKVVRFVDRWDESGPYGKIVSETDRAARDILTFELEGEARVILRPSGTESKNKIYVEVCGPAAGKGAGRDALRKIKEEVDARAHRIAQDFTLLMLERIGVKLPRYALEISDLVPLECKEDFAAAFMPELVARLERGESGPDLERWIDERLKTYGADGRLLVRRAVRAYIDETSPRPEVAQALLRLFPEHA